MFLTYPFLTQSTAYFQKLLFSISSNGINQILAFAIRGICLFLRNTSFSSYNHPRILCIDNSYNPKGIKLLTRLRQGLSHLLEHKFKRSFQDLLILCNCGYEVESTVHFFLHCPLFTNERSTLISTLRDLYSKLFDNTDSLLTNILLFGKESLNTDQNAAILNATMEFILSTKRLDEPLFIS